MVQPPAAAPFVSEIEAYAWLAAAGVTPPHHGLIDDGLTFTPGQPVVLKGLGEGVWHKSELGCVRFLDFDPDALARECAAMRFRIQAEGRTWIGGLVCERIELRRQSGLPSEGFVSLSHGAAGWTILCGFGGLQAEALAELAAPCRWPVSRVTPDEALAELENHLLGRTWLGKLRGTSPLTTREQLRDFLDALWRLPARLEDQGAVLLEMNPVALDTAGRPRPLDAVGLRAVRPSLPPPPPADFLPAILAPRRIALAGVSAQAGGVGRIILDNLRRARIPDGGLTLIKPGQREFLGLPCLPDISGLLTNPVDLLLLALPAPIAADTLSALIRQGGGAKVVALVAGGIGDGADSGGLAAVLTQQLAEARRAGRWTPAVLGPNFLGHWVPATSLDTSFIPTDKLPPPLEGRGRLALLSQSGAFMLCRRSRQPQLDFRLGLALGNQLDLGLADVLTALAEESDPGPVAAYIEGFGPGQLERIADATRKLQQHGAMVVFHRAGHSSAGQAAAASHTGAMAGDLSLEQALLRRSGVHFAATITEFDSALTWLNAFPKLSPGPIGLVTNAGFESVNGSDLFAGGLTCASLDDTVWQEIRTVLAAENLAGLVSSRLPLDLTPMASESAYLKVTELVLHHSAIAVLGLVPFTARLHSDPAGAKRFAAALAALSLRQRRPLGIVVDAGDAYAPYRAAFAAAGLPVFDRMESALAGLRCLSQPV